MPAWSPTRFRRFVRSVDTSTQVVEVVTDAGSGFLKCMGNPQGEHELASELIGTRAAQWLGLPTLDFALMDIQADDEIPFARGGRALAGPAFTTRREMGRPWGGSARDLKSLSNADAVSCMIVLDTWILNCDRHAPHAEGRRPNLGNVFLSTERAPKQLTLLAIDHGHAFTCGRELTPAIAHIDRIFDPRVFGTFPGFAGFITEATLGHTLSRLGELKDASPFLTDVPTSWRLTSTTQAAIAEFLLRRAHYLADDPPSTIERILAEIKESTT